MVSSRTGWVLGLLLGCVLGVLPASAGEFALQWQGSRRWAGPELWASPIYDWRVEEGKLVATVGPDRLLQNTVWRVGKPEDELYLIAQLQIRSLNETRQKRAVWGGFAIGIKGLMDDQRHILVGPKRQLNAGVRGDGTVFLGDAEAKRRVDPTEPLSLWLTKNESGLGLVVFRVNDKPLADGFPEPAAQVFLQVPDEQLAGNIALAAYGPQPRQAAQVPEVVFSEWGGEGDALVANPANAFGPVLWSQYTRQHNDVKLLAMLAPMGEDDPKAVTLQIRQGETWKTIDTQDYDPLTYSAVLRGAIPDGNIDYRVVYNYLGEDRFWHGTFIPDPALTGEPLQIGVFSCDHGYAFPLPTLVKNVKAQKPNLLFFAGDQVYEGYGGFKLKRTPTDLAMLDYLRKYYQFGWTWRDLLATTPSVIIPDDHDVFQGNIWGSGGKWTKNINDGGYVMHPDWVNGVQRTQTAHLPDAHDPTPIQRGIGVYYTDFEWGGVPIAVIEDRKWKDGPNAVLPAGHKQGLSIEAADPAGARLLGERQEAFLSAWSRQTRDAPLRLVLSQTIFCKGHTHTGPNLNQNKYDWDSNGWPRSGRQRALSPFKDGKTVMLHGDQHLGLLVRHGVDRYNDGPYAFMVPGTSNGWPRAWWPNGPEGEAGGDFTDIFGNRFTVLAAGNPEVGANKLKTRVEGDPEQSAHRKGSGYGLVVVDPKTHAVTFNLYRYLFDATKPKPGDQFPGFPVTVEPE
ncbi:MAG: alkaline phosphatase D family protein [Phycisphaeraceae bacterium]